MDVLQTVRCTHLPEQRSEGHDVRGAGAMGGRESEGWSAEDGAVER